MEELMSIGTNIATLIAIGVATVSAIIVAFAGFQYATAGGDPQKVGIAKASFIGAFIGLIIASLAFIGPRIVTDMVIKPVGGCGPGYAGRAELRQCAQEPTGLPAGGLDCRPDAGRDLPDSSAAAGVCEGRLEARGY